MSQWRFKEEGRLYLLLHEGCLPALGRGSRILAVGAPAQHVHRPRERL